MAKLIKIEKGGKEFLFVCESRNTRNGFAHDCTLFVDGYIAEKAKCYYFNRTWERYQYESVCVSAIDKRIAELKERLLELFKSDKKYNRMTQTRRKEFAEIVKGDSEIALYVSVRELLQVKIWT